MENENFLFLNKWSHSFKDKKIERKYIDKVKNQTNRLVKRFGLFGMMGILLFLISILFRFYSGILEEDNFKFAVKITIFRAAFLAFHLFLVLILKLVKIQGVFLIISLFVDATEYSAFLQTSFFLFL